MSKDVTKSRFAWIGTALETAAFMVLCGFIGFGVSLVCVTAADTIVTTRNNARRIVELDKRLDALEAQARAKSGAAEATNVKDAQR